MERLTYKDASGNWVVACNRFWNYLKLKFPAHIRGEAVDRLAAYEETGVEPSDVITAPNMAKIACALHELNRYKELGDIDRLRDLVEADKAGWFLATPCKVGSTVWYLTGNPSMTNRLCFDRVDSAKVAGFYFDERGLQIRLDDFHGSHGTYGFYGKTVFLNRESAESALAKEYNNE